MIGSLPHPHLTRAKAHLFCRWADHWYRAYAGQAAATGRYSGYPAPIFSAGCLLRFGPAPVDKGRKPDHLYHAQTLYYQDWFTTLDFIRYLGTRRERNSPASSRPIRLKIVAARPGNIYTARKFYPFSRSIDDCWVPRIQNQRSSHAGNIISTQPEWGSIGQICPMKSYYACVGRAKNPQKFVFPPVLVILYP